MKLRSVLMFVVLLVSLMVKANEFVVVIDAGHGGKDPGAISANKKIYEKNVVLNVALMVGEAIEKNHPEVKVLYTRKTDKFVGLNDRARMANQADADLFISIHTNAAKSTSAIGAETYTLGVEEERTERNLEIAKRENGVIFLEENHEKKYANFNPNSPESYIIFEFMQSEFVKESIHMAHYVQSNLTADAKRRDRGVRQAGFLVLNATSMPSVLVELGYISNAEEAKFLASASGQKKLSECISKAFTSYYSDLKKQSSDALLANDGIAADRDIKAEASVNEKSTNVDVPIFKVQFMSSSKELPCDDKDFKGLAPVECYYDNGLYKYTYGATVDYNEIVRMKKKVNELFKDAFVVAFIEGKRVNTQQAIALYKENNP